MNHDRLLLWLLLLFDQFKITTMVELFNEIAQQQQSHPSFQHQMHFNLAASTTSNEINSASTSTHTSQFISRAWIWFDDCWWRHCWSFACLFVGWVFMITCHCDGMLVECQTLNEQPRIQWHNTWKWLSSNQIHPNQSHLQVCWACREFCWANDKWSEWNGVGSPRIGSRVPGLRVSAVSPASVNILKCKQVYCWWRDWWLVIGDWWLVYHH